MALLSQAKQSECGNVHYLGLDSYRTLYNAPQQWKMLVLSMKLLKLFLTDQQTDRHLGLIGCDCQREFWTHSQWCCLDGVNIFVNIAINQVEYVPENWWNLSYHDQVTTLLIKDGSPHPPHPPLGEKIIYMAWKKFCIILVIWELSDGSPREI